MKKNLVMGSGKGYNWYTWEPFVRSFVKNVQNADLVLFVDGLMDFTRQMLEQVGKEIQGGELKLVPFPEDVKTGMPVNERWKMFLRYLENYGDDYEQVFVSDTRDVVFQKNIFDCFADQKNFLAYAAEADNIKGSKTKVDLNYMWIEECFGKNEADKLADRGIICGGTTIATLDEMKVYIQKMLEFWPKDWDFHGADQALYQHIVYNNLLPIKNLIKMDCWTGAVFTAYLFHEYNLIETKDDLILRGDGKIPAVVHQYDRHRCLVNMIDKTYRSCDFQPDERFTDLKSNIEQFHSLLLKEDSSIPLEFFTKKLIKINNFSDCGNGFIDCWETLLQKDKFDFSAEILNMSIQHAIMLAFKDEMYVNPAKKIVQALSLCKLMGHRILDGLEEWIRGKVVEVAKWHIKRSNFHRYNVCLRLMIDLDLTDNEYFNFLMAEIFRSFGEVDEARTYYIRFLNYKKIGEVEKQSMLNDYLQKLWSERKFFLTTKKNIITPLIDSKDSNLVFDKFLNTFVLADKKN